MSEVFDKFIEEVKKCDGKPAMICSDGLDKVNRYQIGIMGSGDSYIVSITLNKYIMLQDNLKETK